MTANSMLGIDIGTTDMRIALSRPHDNDFLTEIFITKEMPTGAVVSGVIVEHELVAALIEEILAENAIREKRCVCAVGSPLATLRSMRFPAMTTFERTHAARLETEREQGSLEKVTVRVHPHGDVFLVGASSSQAILSRALTVAKAGLRLVAIDDEGAALCDAFPDVDVIIDIGSERSSLYASTSDGDFLTNWIAVGGDSITTAIAHDLGINISTAKSRKHLLGTAGAGEEAMRRLVESLAEALTLFRRRKRRVMRAALSGGSARLSGLSERIEAHCQIEITSQIPRGLSQKYFPNDIARAIRADCALAVSLARWQAR